MQADSRSNRYQFHALAKPGVASHRFGFALVVIALIAAAYLLGKREGLAASISPPTYHQLTFRGGTIRMARFAPDGKNIVYSAAWEGNPIELLVTRPDSPESRPFGLSKAEVLSISPEGEMAVLLNSHNVDPYINVGTLARVPLGGGAPREVLENVQWADWSPDGTNFAVVREFGGLSRLEYPDRKSSVSDWRMAQPSPNQSQREMWWLSLSIRFGGTMRDQSRSSISRERRKFCPPAGRRHGAWGGLRTEMKSGFPAPGLVTDVIFPQ